MNRSCWECVRCMQWTESGDLRRDCGDERVGGEAWRIHLEDWGVDPAPFCNRFEFDDVEGRLAA